MYHLDGPDEIKAVGAINSWRGLNAWERKLGLELLPWTEGIRALRSYGRPHTDVHALQGTYGPLKAFKAISQGQSGTVQHYTCTCLTRTADTPAQEEGAAARW